MARIKSAGFKLAALVLLATNVTMPADAARKPKKEAAPAPAVPSVKNGVELWRAGDYAGAVAMWQPFANGGDADAMFNIGQAYKLGRAVPKDSVLARDWYRRAAQKGHLPAQANLGILLFQAGEKPEAIRWLKSAADRNEMRAQYVLGVANWNGDGTPRNMTLAYAYLSRAAAQGLPEATTALGNLTSSISPLERANGWAVATSLAAGNGVPPEFSGPGGRSVPVAMASADRYTRDQVVKPLPPATSPTPAYQPQVLQGRPGSAVATTVPAVTETVPTQIARPLPPPVTTASVPVQSPAAVTTPRPLPPALAPVVKAPVVVAQAPAPRPVAPVMVAQALPPTPKPVLTAPIPKPIPAPVPPVPVERPAAPPVTSIAIPASTPPAAVVPQPKSPPKAIEVAAAPKPIAKPAAKPVPTGWRVQLGAFSKRTQAEAAWSEVKTKQKQLVANSKPIFTDDGNVIKLQMGPYPSKAAARDACAKIAFSGRACFVTEG